MNRNIYLEGEIGEKFGKSFNMNVISFPEVFKCLECNFPDFRQYLLECHENNIGFVCEVAGTPLESEKELLLEYVEGDMVITALPAGSKSGGQKLLAAIAIVAVIYFTGGFGAEGYIQAGFAEGASTVAQMKAYAAIGGLSMATNLALTGIQQIMAPDPSVDNDQDENYLFQGTAQTIIEGDPVPVLYGKLRVPGRPISTQVRGEKQAYYDSGTNIIISDDLISVSTPSITGITVPSSINEGSASTITVSTSNINDGTTLYWEVRASSNGINAETDFEENTDNFTITSNSGSFDIEPSADSLTEGTESFFIRVYGGGLPYAVDSAVIDITDTSTGSTSNPTKQIVSIAASSTDVDEGDAVTFTVTTSGVANDVPLNYSLVLYSTQASDFLSYVAGEVSVQNNSATIEIFTSADTLTEGNQTFAISISGEDIESKTSSTITINDTSLTPATPPDDDPAEVDPEQEDDRGDIETPIFPPYTFPDFSFGGF